MPQNAQTATLLAQTLIVLPVMNEAENITSVIAALKGTTPNSHIVVVDGGSQDASVDVVSALIEEYEGIFLLQQLTSTGLAQAFLMAYEFAVEGDYRAVIQMDADGYHIANNVHEIAELFILKPGLVLGSRASTREANDRKVRTRVRSTLTQFGNLYNRFWLSTGIYDNTTGLRMLSRDLLKTILRSRVVSKGFAFNTESVFIARENRFAISEIELKFSHRVFGKSKLSTRIILEALLIPPLLRLNKHTH